MSPVLGADERRALTVPPWPRRRASEESDVFAAGAAGRDQPDTSRRQARGRRVRADDDLRGAALRTEHVVADERFTGAEKDRVPGLRRVDRGLEVRVHAPTRADGRVAARADPLRRTAIKRPQTVSRMRDTGAVSSRMAVGGPAPGRQSRRAGSWSLGQEICHALGLALLSVSGHYSAAVFEPSQNTTQLFCNNYTGSKRCWAR